MEESVEDSDLTDHNNNDIDSDKDETTTTETVVLVQKKGKHSSSVWRFFGFALKLLALKKKPLLKKQRNN